MKDFHCCATCRHFRATKKTEGMKYDCSRLGFETKTNYKFNCWSPKEHVIKLINKKIRRPKMEDMEELHQFFKVVITDTFKNEGLAEKLDDIAAEIEVKKKYLQFDLESNGVKRYFLLAVVGEKIIGSIEFGPASELICTCTNNALKGYVEVGTVFVLPDYQQKGVGGLLLNEMVQTLKDRGIEEFCLDSGYTRAQQIWKKKFGEPAYLLKDYWSEGYDHMIWRIKVDDFLK